MENNKFEIKKDTRAKELGHFINLNILFKHIKYI